MSSIYTPAHRALQEEFDTLRLADMMEGGFTVTEFGDADRAFVESRDMFFLSTVDSRGRPTVSYKGGDPGFVRVLDSKTLAFPFYDGNGMFYSWGNLANNAQVGLLFINFQKPQRLRVQGVASVDRNDPLLSEYHEAQGIVRVAVEGMWPNCPRYVHRYEKVAHSRYVPKTECQTPLAGWKRIDVVQDALPAQDKGRADKEGGVLTPEEWYGKVAEGSHDA
jgi:predicted pyridoxine 5'-phosphate oxidase superfamily flavin-nucleotide-binding protein